jgi:hypothetical protein
VVPAAAASALGYPSGPTPPIPDGSPAPQIEPMIDIPVSMLKQFVESLARLELLDRRESIRLVEREQRKARPRTRF